MALLSAAGKNLKLSAIRRKGTGRRRPFADGSAVDSGPAALRFGPWRCQCMGFAL